MKIEKNIKIYDAPIGKQCAVYLLMNNEDEVIYVGKSVTGIKRVYSHNDIKYSKFGIIECLFEELTELEDFYIMKYQPMYNKRLSKQRIKLTTFFGQLKNRYKELGIDKIKEIILKGGIKIEFFKDKEIFESKYINFAKELIEKEMSKNDD